MEMFSPQWNLAHETALKTPIDSPEFVAAVAAIGLGEKYEWEQWFTVGINARLRDIAGGHPVWQKLLSHSHPRVIVLSLYEIPFDSPWLNSPDVVSKCVSALLHGRVDDTIRIIHRLPVECPILAGLSHDLRCPPRGKFDIGSVMSHIVRRLPAGSALLAKLVTDSDPRIRCEVGSWTACLETRRQLLTDPEWDVRKSAVCGLKRDSPDLDAMASDPHPEVRRHVAGVARWSSAVMSKLVKDTDPEVARSAAQYIEWGLAAQKERQRKAC